MERWKKVGLHWQRLTCLEPRWIAYLKPSSLERVWEHRPHSGTWEHCSLNICNLWDIKGQGMSQCTSYCWSMETRTQSCTKCKSQQSQSKSCTLCCNPSKWSLNHHMCLRGMFIGTACCKGTSQVLLWSNNWGTQSSKWEDCKSYKDSCTQIEEWGHL